MRTLVRTTSRSEGDRLLRRNLGTRIDTRPRPDLEKRISLPCQSIQASSGHWFEVPQMIALCQSFARMPLPPQTRCEIGQKLSYSMPFFPGLTALRKIRERAADEREGSHFFLA